MRLLQAMGGAENGGAEAFFLRLSEAFHRQKVIQQRVLVRRGSAWCHAFRENGIDADELPFGGLFDFHTTRLFRSQINDFKPDIVLTWMNRATKFCPTLRSADGIVHVARLGGYYGLKNYRACDHLIGNTRDIVKYFTDNGWPAKRAHYLPNFVSEGRQLPLPRCEFDTPAGVPLIVALGRLHANKAFDVLLHAMVGVPFAWLWIAGEGPQRKVLETLVEELDLSERVRFLGWRNDTEAIYAAADVFVCPSRYEPLGNVVIEAWAQMRPVVAANAVGPAALISDSENGLLVPVDESTALAVALNRVIDDEALRAQIVAGGLASYEQEFTEETVVGRYLEFFRAVAEPA